MHVTAAIHDTEEVSAILPAPAEQTRLTIGLMVTSLDGRTTDHGRVGRLTGPADQQLLAAARERAAAVVVGAATVRAEGYGRLLDDPAQARRRAQSMRPEPLLVIVGRRMAGLEATEALRPGGPEMILALSQRAPADLPHHVTGLELSSGTDGGPDLRTVWRAVRERVGDGLIVCEGGPRLLAQAVLQGLADELVLTISPALVWDAGPTLLSGESAPLRRVDLRAAITVGGFAMLRYGVI